jgi:ribosomal-protein-alanine N-acetyltransferase
MSLLNSEVFKSFPILETERTRLRDFRESDLEEFHSIRTDAEVRKFIAKPIEQDIEVTRKVLLEVIDAFKNHAALNWVIENKATGEFIGSAGYWRIDLANNRAELGYSIKTKYWGQGIMTEVLAKILPFAFKSAGNHSIMACVDVQNIGSQKLLLKSGFKQEAHHRQDWYFNGKYYDSLIYGMIESDLKNEF